MKKIIYLLFSFLFIINVNAKEYNSNNVLLINLDNNQTIYEDKSEEIIRIASLTKITTTIVAIEKIENLDNSIIITEDMLQGLMEANAQVVGYKVGEKVTYRDLLYATLLHSGADATRAIAISLTGSEKEFVKLMNEKAKELNMLNTHYVNTSGLDVDNHYSTLKDISIILKYALENETFKKIYTTTYYYDTTNRKIESTLSYNIRKYGLEASFIKGAKTGYTTKAGYCFSAIATNKDINYLLLTAGADSTSKLPLHVMDAITIFNYYFNNYGKYEIVSTTKPLLSIDNKYSNNKIDLYSSINYSDYMLQEQYENLEYEYEGLEEINLFTKKGKIGIYRIISNDNIIKEIDINRPEKIEFSIVIFIYKHILLVILIIGGIYAIKKNTSRATAS